MITWKTRFKFRILYSSNIHGRTWQQKRELPTGSCSPWASPLLLPSLRCMWTIQPKHLLLSMPYPWNRLHIQIVAVWSAFRKKVLGKMPAQEPESRIRDFKEKYQVSGPCLEQRGLCSRCEAPLGHGKGISHRRPREGLLKVQDTCKCGSLCFVMSYWV